MKLRLFGILVVTLLASNIASHAQYVYKPTKAYYNDSTLYPKKRVMRATTTAVGLNLGIWAFDRFALNADYARINFSTISNNFKTGFLWDNDMFPTNLFAHPYHGSMYFNAARTNGMNFWQSLPYTVGGSAMWELFMENQPPSMNDIIATPIGGMILGEITYRLSSAVLDGSTVGAERVGRELLGAVLSPISALNRMIDGSMWRTQPRPSRGARYYPIMLTALPGVRYISEGRFMFKGGLNPYVKFSLAYGDPFGNENTKPFDYFTVSGVLNIGGRQPLISTVNARGMLWGNNIETHDNQEMLIGIFQHFNYYDSKSTVEDSDVIPYMLAETASFGAGTIYKLQSRSKKLAAMVGLHVSGILLGGTMSDIYHVGERNYNMGSGFSTKMFSLVNLAQVGSFNLTADFYNLYTWKGYPQDIDWENVDSYHLNAQGDESSTRMAVISPAITLHVVRNMSVNFGGDFYWRKTDYKHYESRSYSSFELKTGMAFQF